MFSLDNVFGCTSRLLGGTGLWILGSAGMQWVLGNPGHKQQKHQEVQRLGLDIRLYHLGTV